MKVVIGSHQDKTQFTLDIGVLADTRGLICASSGAGKSYLLRVLAENVGDKVQTIIIDPEGEFATLREKLDILIVGENGDIKPDIKSAGLLARRLMESGVSAVIDIYDLPGKGDPWDKRRLFVYAFLTGLMNIPKELYHPVLVIVDEAHNFAMETPSKSGRELVRQYFKMENTSPSLLSLSAVRSMMSAGRKRGIGGILATQRVSKIDKDSIADARNVFIGGTSLDTDQTRAGDMLGMKKSEAIQALRALSPGEFYCFGSAVQGPRNFGVHLFQANQAKTTHPKAGQRLKISVPKASAVISGIAKQLSDLSQQAEYEENKISSMQNEIERLRREISSRPVQSQNVRIERVNVPVLSNEQIDNLKTYTFMMNGNATAMIENLENIQRSAQEITSALLKFADNKNAQSLKIVAMKRNENASVDRKPVPSQRNHAESARNSDITNPEQRILDAIAWFESIGIMEPRQEAVAFLAGYTYGGGAFNNPRGKLNTRGFVSYRGKSITLTDAGRSIANAPAQPLTKEDLHNHVMEVLPKPHQVILRHLLDLYPNPIGKEELSDMVGKRGGAFNNPLGRLRSFGLIDYPERGAVVAMPFLFME